MSINNEYPKVTEGQGGCMSEYGCSRHYIWAPLSYIIGVALITKHRSYAGLQTKTLCQRWFPSLFHIDLIRRLVLNQCPYR